MSRSWCGRLRIGADEAEGALRGALRGPGGLPRYRASAQTLVSPLVSESRHSGPSPRRGTPRGARAG